MKQPLHGVEIVFTEKPVTFFRKLYKRTTGGVTGTDTGCGP